TGSSSIRFFTAILLIAITLLLVAGAAINSFLERRQAQESSVIQVRAAAEGVAGQLAVQIGLYGDMFRGALQNPGLIAALNAGDQGEVRQYEKRIRDLIPRAAQVQILPANWDDTVSDHVSKLSFASIELLKRVEQQNKASLAEVHTTKQGKQRISMVAPIGDGNREGLAGVALLQLQLSVLNESIDRILSYGGQVEVQQVVAGEAVRLVSTVTAAMDKRSMSGTVPVEGTIWRVAYWNGGGSGGISGLLAIWGVAAVILMLVAGVVLFLVGRIKAALQQDQVKILSIAEGLVGGRSPRPGQAALQELQNTLELLSRLGRPKGAKAPGVQEQSEQPTPRKRQRMGGKWQESDAQGMPSDEELMIDEPVPEEGGLKPGVLSPEVFRICDIRGIAGKTLSPELFDQLGRAIGTEAHAKGQQTVIVARDGRNSSQELSEALCQGLMASGRDVVDIGLVPTPILYFATHFLGSSSGVMVTGSHNPSEYNGLKIVIAGEALHGEQIQDLRRRIEQGNLILGNGSVKQQDLVPDYLNRVAEDVQLVSPLKLVVDCGNGAASVVAPALFRALGCQVTDLFCEVNGSFPNHHPNPSDPENMRALIEKVRETGADLGVAFDGDGDRLGVVDSSGKIIWPDRLLILLARDVLLRNPGVDIIYDVKSTRHLASEILANGGRPIMWKSGHSLMKSKLTETGALLAGEMTGHIYFKERWYGFDDALYSCARLLEVLAIDAEYFSTAENFAQLPESVATPELLLPMAEGENVAVMQQLLNKVEFPNAKVINIDGIRAEFSDGWGLVRASNTVPSLKFRFEADSEDALERIQGMFKERIQAAVPGIQPPF
ncbi:MAG: phosphomannomutase/phosphoglucomutase, partial [Gammaproteobacteria bacterium]|nr:phosphomannomutase/phosphoglucomutase [Gammaproteobacteria bacterium]